MSINFVELQGPLILPQEANLYEQTPFAEKLDQVLNPGVELDALRAFLTDCSGRSTEKVIGIFFNANKYNIRHSLTYSLSQSRIKNPATRVDEYVEALHKTGQLMGPYPYWCEYIRGVFNQYPRLFRRNGERKNIPQSPTMSEEEVPTYLGWLPGYTRKVERQEDKVLLGIDQIFPQDFATESPTRPPEVKGNSQVARNWQFRIAANLTPER